MILTFSLKFIVSAYHYQVSFYSFYAEFNKNMKQINGCEIIY